MMLIRRCQAAVFQSTTVRALSSGRVDNLTPSFGARQVSLSAPSSTVPDASLSYYSNNVAVQTAARRFFASSLAQTVREVNEKRENEARRPKPLVDVQKQLWEFYLSTGRGANALFEAIDIRESGTIEPAELKNFMMSVLKTSDGEQIDPKELMPYAWNRLEQREAANQTYDMRGFKKWLVAATKMSADMKNSRMLEYMAQNPNKEEHYFSDVDDEASDLFTWNEETMSQSLRRMQYAGMYH
jgi:hypothetical protein